MNSNELHVIFGTGPLGKNTMRALVDMGKRVRMVNRSGKADVPAAVEVVSGDAYNPASTREVSKGAASIYQCAQPPYHEWLEKFPALQSAILEGAAANGAKLIVGDNLYMYGAPDGKPISADSAYKPVSKKGQVRAAMAEAILSAHKSGNLRATIGRASDFVGPDYDIVGDMVFRPALVGKNMNFLGAPDVPHTYTYIPDFGRALAVLGTDDRSLGQVWIAPSLQPVTVRELATLIWKAAGQPGEPKFSAMSKLMVRIGGFFSPGARETVEMMYAWEKPYVVDSSKFERTFGISPTPVETVIRDSVAWYKANLHTK